MIDIAPIHAFDDNYIWAITHQQTNQTIVVDPGQADPVLDYLSKNERELSQIWITHEHFDHVGGVQQLQQHFPSVTVVAHQTHGINQDFSVDDGSQFQVHDCHVKVWKVKGHTDNHLAYLLTIAGKTHVFCGDTLFSGGCGRVFTGDMQAMHESLQRLLTLEDATLFYPAHEYTASNLKFGLYITPDNQAMQQRLAEVEILHQTKIPSVPTTLEQEKQINIFLQVNQSEVRQRLKAKLELKHPAINMTDRLLDPAKVFAELRQLKDNF